ncbi:hypothetical protein AVEN_64228-1 [Araneus ventricosus]|uniref:Uncharacterized protein n=1 Tax=Araneus ventricosus TaxID=182803 RepID=A0A4Y2TLK7_ARAVE|nr:hypothetical protein AVEN_64228-1 [Araneus ventricosus]
MVLIQIYSVNDRKIKKILWQNPFPSSTRYYHPIKFMFAKETLIVINTKVKRIKDQVISLLPAKISINDKEVSVKPTLIFCMIDGKICNAVAGYESTQICYLCGAKPSEMNDERIIMQKTVNRDLLSLGLSPLHTWIRFLECILHFSYRLEIKSWQVEELKIKTKWLSRENKFKTNLRARPKTKCGKISNEVHELLEIRAPAPIDQDAILSESSNTEESESDLEESDLDSK